MEKTLPLDSCRSVFKAGDLSRDAYTRVWIKLINTMEKNKKVRFDHKFTDTTKINEIIGSGMACPTEGGWDDE